MTIYLNKYGLPWCSECDNCEAGCTCIKGNSYSLERRVEALEELVAGLQERIE